MSLFLLVNTLKINILYHFSRFYFRFLGIMGISKNPAELLTTDCQ